MRDVLFIFWGVVAGLTAVAGGTICAALWVNGVPPVYVAASALGWVFSVVCCLTVQFVVDNVGKGCRK